MYKPLDTFNLPLNIQNQFGGIRKHDIHTGVDLFCNEGDNVYSIETGIITNIFQFTGKNVNSPWWNDTYGILIKGNYNILYGEIQPLKKFKVGDIVNEGEIIGNVLTVLKKNKGLPMTMLHIELYENNYVGDGVIWNLNKEKPKELLDITNLLYEIKNTI